MGEAYKEILEAKIQELGGGSGLRVYINSKGVDPHYRQHLQDTFEGAGVRFVDSREGANFVFDGHCEPIPHDSQVTAFFRGNQLAFTGGLSSQHSIERESSHR